MATTVIVTRSLQFALLQVYQMRLLLQLSRLLQDLPYHRITNVLPREFFQANTYFAITVGRR